MSAATGARSAERNAWSTETGSLAGKVSSIAWSRASSAAETRVGSFIDRCYRRRAGFYVAREPVLRSAKS